MIIFFAEGKFGNQLFQYAFLESIRKTGETMITAGLDDVKKYCVTRSYINMSRYDRLSRICAYQIGERLVSLLARMRIITTIRVDREVVKGIVREKMTYTRVRGISTRITYVARGYFQSEKFIDKKKIAFLKLKTSYIQEAHKILDQVPSNKVPIFVHVRRGDYRDFTISGQRTFLPLAYYHRGIARLVRKYANAYFIFLSDEPGTISSDFENITNKMVVHNDPGVDMAVMTLCQGGILSPSSFSWWGSYFMRVKRDVIAPAYWLGHNMGVEYHEGTTPSYAQTIKVVP